MSTLATRADEKPLVRIAMVGHVDHGKSTLIGRIRHEMSGLPGIASVDASVGGNWAFVMDQLQEEREREMTIDTTQTFLETPVCRLVFIDVPGHQELIQNMLSGATRADAAVLVLAGDEGVQVQTRRHALLLSMLGIRTVIVAVNKMDTLGRREDEFRRLERTAAEELEALGLAVTATIPVVAREGDNVLHGSAAMPWYTGPSVMDAIGDLEPAVVPVDAARFAVQGVLRHDGPATVVGKVLTGSIAEGDALTVCPGGGAVKVRTVRRFPENRSPAEAGESVGLVVDGPEPERGDVLAPPGDLPRATTSPAGRVFWLAERPLAVGEELALRCATQLVPVRVESVADRLDTATLEPLPDAPALASMEIANVRLSSHRPVVLESFDRLAALGRFVLERGGAAAGFGTVG
ncbi:MAG TPA: GTP-binding protein [Thermoanaerobaculaceae bacterium]|nr:GTP-binding protein [Thermoanaerobaculaceae bacterium]